MSDRRVPYYVSSDSELTPRRNGSTVVNVGATGPLVLSLPRWSPNVWFTIYIEEAFGITIRPVAGDQIRLGGQMGSENQGVVDDVPGHCLTVQAIRPGLWGATGITGTWNLE